MKLEVSVPEVVELFKEIQQQPEKLFDMIRCDIKEGSMVRDELFGYEKLRSLAYKAR